MIEETRNASLFQNTPCLFGGRVRHERRDAMEHRQRILHVAQNLFAEHGVHAVSMHQIAKAAGIGQGTLYRRYAHKGDLCMDLLQEQHERLLVDITTLFTTKATAPALERLDGVLSLSITLLEEQGALLGSVALTEMQETMCDESAKAQHIPFYLWLHGLFAGLLTEAVERKELVALDTSFTADAILATLNPMFYRMQRQERGLSPEHILQGLRHIYINGIKALHSAEHSMPDSK
ncbi:MAG: TetR/AcrR family transcriptional regulator [Ktedonobacteraceae bacterium]